jgi:DNA-binding MarR family transcriptional regulator
MHREDGDFWNAAADGLASERAGALSGAGAARWRAFLGALLPPEKPLRVLDMGTGSGFAAILLAGLGHAVIGVDSAPAMIQCAYEASLSRKQRIDFRVMNCRRMDFEDESFDAVVACELFGHLDEPARALAEGRRLLKKGGLLVSLDAEGGLDERARGLGFLHILSREARGLAALGGGAALVCLTARRPAADEQAAIPQVALFGRHIRFSRRQAQLYQNWFQARPLSFTEYSVMHMVSHHARGVRPSDIAAALVMPPQTLTGVLARLEREGLIRRQTSREDHRSALIFRTERGEALFQPLHRRLRDIEERALCAFSQEELSALARLDDRLLEALRAAFDAEG